MLVANPPQVRPRVSAHLFAKLDKLGLTVDDAIELVISGIGTKMVPKGFLLPGHRVKKVSEVRIDTSLLATESTLSTISTESTLAALNSKIDEEIDDNIIIKAQTLPVNLTLPYNFSVDNDRWERVTIPAGVTFPPYDLASLGGTALNATSVLGGLGTGLICGIGSAAGNLLGINAQGDMSAIITDLSGDDIDLILSQPVDLPENTNSIPVSAFNFDYDAGDDLWYRRPIQHFTNENLQITLCDVGGNAAQVLAQGADNENNAINQLVVASYIRGYDSAGSNWDRKEIRYDPFATITEQMTGDQCETVKSVLHAQDPNNWWGGIVLDANPVNTDNMFDLTALCVSAMNHGEDLEVGAGRSEPVKIRLDDNSLPGAEKHLVTIALNYYWSGAAWSRNTTA